MLVIRRRAGEAVTLSGGIEVVVLEVSGNRVKLGVLAPPEIQVARKELQLAAQQNLAAAASTPRQSLDSVAGSLREASDRRSP